VRFAGLLEQNGYSVLLDTIHTDGDMDDIMEIAIKQSAVVRKLPCRRPGMLASSRSRPISQNHTTG
jgi:hypothetical protein